MGHSLLTQFDGLEFRQVTLPFISTVDKAEEAVREDQRDRGRGGRAADRVQHAGAGRPARRSSSAATACSWISSTRSSARWSRSSRSSRSQRAGRAHGMRTCARTRLRINATNFALAERRRRGHARLRPRRRDPGRRVALGQDADLPLHGAAVRRVRGELPAHRGRLRDRSSCRRRCARTRAKLFGLTIAPERLQQIRNERRPGSRYASIRKCEFEVRSAENLFQRHGIP